MQLEERIKYALKYELSFETPMAYVERFFAYAFSPELRQVDGPLKTWYTFTQSYIRNTTIFPLSQDFHPVYIAAAYLSVSKQVLESLW